MIIGKHTIILYNMSYTQHTLLFITVAQLGI